MFLGRQCQELKTIYENNQNLHTQNQFYVVTALLKKIL